MTITNLPQQPKHFLSNVCRISAFTMDFQPVLMAAGRGSRLTPLSDKIAKCLLPIGNIPMLWFPLRSLDLAGFKGKCLASY